MCYVLEGIYYEKQVMDFLGFWSGGGGCGLVVVCVDGQYCFGGLVCWGGDVDGVCVVDDDIRFGECYG